MTANLSFARFWDYELGPLQAMQATSNADCLALLGADGRLHLVDGEGNPCCTSDLGKDVRTISLADTRETLAVTDTGHALLVDAEGRTLFKKRSVHAVTGAISGSGQWLALAARDPLVILADRTGRARWTYRHLEKAPTALDLSHDGETTVFGCLDDRGEGLAAVARDGKPFDPILGLDPVRDVAISGNGRTVVALDRGGGVFRIDCVNSFGLWKRRLEQPFHGLSHAGETGQTLLFNHEGILLLLDEDGEPVWEHRLGVSLVRARISADGRTIAWASPEGMIGCLRAGLVADQGTIPASHDFAGSKDLPGSAPPTLEAASPGAVPVVTPGAAEVSSPRQATFQRVWEMELDTPAAGDRSRFLRWAAVDGVEYLLLWNGRDSLSLLNDRGEEIWQQRVLGGPLLGLGVSASADLILAVARQGVMGLKLGGRETFKLFGDFTAGHPFADGSFLLVDKQGGVRFYRNANHFLHQIELGEPARALTGWEDGAWIIGQNGVLIVDAAGTVQGGRRLEGGVACWSIDPTDERLVIGGRNGELGRIDRVGGWQAWKPLSGPIKAASCHGNGSIVFAAVEDQTRLDIVDGNGVTPLALKAEPHLLLAHPSGAVVGTSIDELLLIDPGGVVIARYTFPDRLLDLMPARNGGLYVLAEGSLSHFSLGVEPTPQGSSGGARFLEL